MYILRGFIVTVVLLILQDGTASAQSAPETTGYLSLSVGFFTTDNSRFSDTYDSPTSFVIGGGLGIPVVNRLHLVGKVTHFAKNSSDDTAHFKQWIVNGGLQYGLPLTEGVIMDFQAGVTYSSVSEVVSYGSPGSSSSSLTVNGMLGFWAGVGAERFFPHSPFSLFAELQYNITRSDVSALVGTYGGLNASLGFRYHFNHN